MFPHQLDENAVLELSGDHSISFIENPSSTGSKKTALSNGSKPSRDIIPNLIGLCPSTYPNATFLLSGETLYFQYQDGKKD